LTRAVRTFASSAVVAELFSEGHAVQTAQAVLWALSAVVALATASRRRGVLDRGVAAWQGALAFGALVRELDLHERLHAATPVHFRLRWLLESDASLWWKAGVVGLVLLAVGVALAPVVVWRAHWWTLLRRGDRDTWLLLAALGCVLAGYLLDDVVGRWARTDRARTKIVEEVLELAGAAVFWAAVEGERARPLTVRLAS
jgi:hypothetical protein